MLVENYISWLDIVVIHATRTCRFVSKYELPIWNLRGNLAIGFVFLEVDGIRHLVRSRGLRDVYKRQAQSHSPRQSPQSADPPAVTYTHLTLPTILTVYTSVGCTK